MGSDFEILVEIDALDAVIGDALENPRYGRGFIDVERRQVGSGRIVYGLTNKQIGEIGKITLKKINHNSTWLCLLDVIDPGARQLTNDELARLQKTRDRAEKIYLISEIDKARHEERQQLKRKREEHFALVIDWLEYCIDADLGHVLRKTGQAAGAGQQLAAGEPGAGDDLQDRVKNLFPRQWQLALDILKVENGPYLSRVAQAEKLGLPVDTLSGWVTKLAKAGLINTRK